MRLSGYQPHYFPRLHYIKRSLDSDIFEVSDYLQFVKKHLFKTPDGLEHRGKSYQAHASVKLHSGIHYLVIPTRDKLESINQTPIMYEQNWAAKHLQTIKVAFSGAAEFTTVYPELEKLFSVQYQYLGELTTRTVLWSLIRIVTDEKITDVSVDTLNTLLRSTKHPYRLRTIMLASQSGLPYNPGNPSKWIIDMCKKLGATEYFTGGSAMTTYMNPALFEKEGIKVTVQDWSCPVYTQRYPHVGFLSNLSALDLIMNVPLLERQNIMR